MNISRRNLLSSATALTVLGPGIKAAFADTPATSDILVVLFQRGACDWLQMLAPAGDANYIAARPTLRVQTTGANAGIGIGTFNNVDLYLNNAAPELKTLYDTGRLAFVHAAGLLTDDRSHFTCQDQMEKGVADADPIQNTGWLARHLTSIGPSTAPLSTVASGSSNPASLLGEPNTVAIANAAQFNVAGGAVNAQLLRSLTTGTTPYKTAATTTLNTVSLIQAGLQNTGTNTASNAGYTGGNLSRSLQSVAQLIKMNVGLSVVTVDQGGWDHHNNLAAEFRNRAIEFSRSIQAFWNDITDFQNRVTLVTMTEFGRRLQENTSQGTDHGSGGGMLVLGGNVNGGKIYGTWPGLAPNQLHSGDLAVTTDYRQVVSEILVKRHGETKLATVFPTVNYKPLGIIKST